LIGAVVGGVIGGPMADRFSRRYALLAMAGLYAIGAILTSVSWDLGSFVAFRIITGVAVGASSLVVPMYIAELSPVSIRGGPVILQQLAISGGILISYVLDFAFDSAGWGWRPMFAAAVLPAAVLAAGMLKMSHSPRWLGMRDRWDDAGAVVGRINPRHKDEELDLLRRNVEESEGTSWRELLRPGMRGALIAGVGLAVFQQFVGPNTVLFYTPTIFGYAGVTGTRCCRRSTSGRCCSCSCSCSRPSRSWTPSAARSCSTSGSPAWGSCWCCSAWRSRSAPAAGAWACC
jgi:MFS family permease